MKLRGTDLTRLAGWQVPHRAVSLVDTSNGAILKKLAFSGPIFAQAVFEDDQLLVAGPSRQTCKLKVSEGRPERATDGGPRRRTR